MALSSRSNGPSQPCHDPMMHSRTQLKLVMGKSLLVLPTPSPREIQRAKFCVYPKQDFSSTQNESELL
ncbi:hypothetical protein I79_000463 [Cricetulus griseus]|uniref:Uncharacterized protein n=1 Tax=Cricetulus griseus TaxID=10029 RepID=G3GSE0_CRIGR|nr:hypothetical protein I79_000463 [Cricetulus griseus]